MELMQPELKLLYSPDAEIRNYVPEDPERFCLFVQAFIGSSGSSGMESFDFSVCSPLWLADFVRENGPIFGFHHIIMESFDEAQLRNKVSAYCQACSGNSWDEIAMKLNLMGRWEFYEYKP